MEEKKEKLYIPSYVKAEQEYLPGFGKKELHISAVMSIVIVFFSVTFWIFTRDMTIAVLTFLVGVSGAVMINRKTETNLSVVGFIVLMIIFFKEQQRFLYRYEKEW